MPNVRLKRELFIEIYKTLYNLNSSFIKKDLFKTRKMNTALRENIKMIYKYQKWGKSLLRHKAWSFCNCKVCKKYPFSIKILWKNVCCWCISKRPLSNFTLVLGQFGCSESLPFLLTSLENLRWWSLMFVRAIEGSNFAWLCSIFKEI